MRPKTLTSPLAILSLALLTGTLACDIDSAKSEERGVLLMKLTDAPIDDVESVFVTFSEVAVQRCVDSEQEAQEQAKEADKKEKPAKGKPEKEESEEDESDEDQSDEDDSQEDSDNEDETEQTRAELALDSTYSDEEQEEDDEDDGDEEDDEDEDEAEDQDEDEADDEDKERNCEHGVWEVLELGEQTKFDLLTLQNGKTADLGIATLPSGKYGQIRIKLDAAEIVVKGETVPLTVPSGMQSGLKIVGGFEVVSGEQTAITVDFDAGLSVKYVKGAGWKMKPVIRLLK